MSIINSVRETVLSVLNKNNYGYITPSDFNLYAKQAQLDIFEDYFYQYNYQLMKENARASGVGYADLKKGYEEAIDIFSEQNFLVPVYANGASQTLALPSASASYSVPSTATTGSDYYLINKILLLTKYLVVQSTNTVGLATVQFTMKDSTLNFSTVGVKPGDVVVNKTTSEVASVLFVDQTDPSLLYLDAGIFITIGDSYCILSLSNGVNECEKVTNRKITQLNMSNLTKPTELFPAYSNSSTVIQVYPQDIQVGVNEGQTSLGRVLCQYIRYPKDPKWTYASLVGGTPAFNPSSSLYQDFELPLDDEPSLVNKILQYAGMSIRENEIAQFGQVLDTTDNQNEK
ncbi:MAG: putative structural protein [Prokaryotic dsDNA virus sp.]|nr:MAG: putative structural protein [Prokaryotic dsDNA virus sp.]|tara:strand:- start:1786 stop:2820 length:1035 start_codon:yes stop_codon:yes gene_type:complete